jgi:hypothetical protein
MKNLIRGVFTLLNKPPKKLQHPSGCENNTISPNGKLKVKMVIFTMLLSTGFLIFLFLNLLT